MFNKLMGKIKEEEEALDIKFYRYHYQNWFLRGIEELWLEKRESRGENPYSIIVSLPNDLLIY